VAEAQTLPEELSTAADRLEEAGRTVLVLTSETGPLGLIAVMDRPRADAMDIVMDLKDSGINRVVMLTGDAERAARAVADLVAVDDVRAGLLPGQKRDAIDLLERDSRVAMVGDGVNDAPALAAATIGIAMGAVGSDAALEAADIALMGDSLRDVERSIRLGRRTMQIIRQNVALALGIKLLFLGAILAGWATLWMAVVADTGASVLVTLNAMRLMRAGGAE
jgi:Cd2+/Zn2+-exporting ATPase